MHGSATFYFTLKFDSIAKLPYIFGWHDLNTDFFFFLCGVGGDYEYGTDTISYCDYYSNFHRVLLKDLV